MITVASYWTHIQVRFYNYNYNNNSYGGSVFARVGLDFLMCDLYRKKEIHMMISNTRVVLKL